MATIYKQQCVGWGNAIRLQADSFYDHQIQATRNLIKSVIEKNQNPRAVDLEGGIATINYEELLQRTIEAKQAAYQEADNRVQTCDANAVPDWLADAQKTSDYAMTIALLPYIALTKNYTAAKIDLGEVYKGRTFGGDNALIPKAREDALNALGIGGDVAVFFRDPANAVQNAVASAIEEAKKLLPKIELPKIDLPNIDPPNIPGVKLW